MFGKCPSGASTAGGYPIISDIGVRMLHATSGAWARTILRYLGHVWISLTTVDIQHVLAVRSCRTAPPAAHPRGCVWGAMTGCRIGTEGTQGEVPGRVPMYSTGTPVTLRVPWFTGSCDRNAWESDEISVNWDMLGPPWQLHEPVTQGSP